VTSAVAVIIGVDAYGGQPLTSAVRDALAFRDALLQLSLVDAGSVTLLAAPAQDGGLLATRDEITAALRQPYLHGDSGRWSGHELRERSRGDPQSRHRR
jgi:hypothetical protein